MLNVDGITLNVEHKTINDVDVYIIDFKSKKYFADILLRISEFKECPVHNNKTFSRKEYDIWFSKTETLKYEDTVAGINLPTENFINFYNHFVNESGKYKITGKEQIIFHWLIENGNIEIKDKKISSKKRFFVIAYNEELMGKESRDDVLRHELSHALFYADKKYANLITESWANISDDDMKNVSVFMSNNHYQDDVKVDEFGAYTVEGYNSGFGNIVSETKEIKEIKEYFENKIYPE